MYPTLTDLLKGVFGFYLPLPVQTFGFLMFIAFVAAYWTLSSELKRKETSGLLKPTPISYRTGEKAGPLELIFNAVLGFFTFFKIPEIFSHYHAFTEDPAGFLFTKNGNLPLGISGAVIFAAWTWYEKSKTALEKPVVTQGHILPHELMGNVVMIAAGFGLVGAKVFDNLENWDRFIIDPVGNLFSPSGLTFYGGMICGGAAVIVYMAKHGVKPLVMLDVGTPGLMLGYGIGRIGCHLSGDGDWGIVNSGPKPSVISFLPDWFWSFSYPHNVNDEGVLIPGCLGKHCHELVPPVFPTPLYESVVCIGLFLALWYLRKRIATTGALFFFYLALNGAERFSVELIRVNTRYHLGSLSFTQAELISSILFVTGVLGLTYVLNSAKIRP